MFEWWIVLVAYEMLVYWLMSVIFWFLPEILTPFALSILVLDITKILEKNEKTAWKILVQVLYGIFMVLKIVPIDWSTLTATVQLEEVLAQVMLVFPYICVLLLPALVMKIPLMDKILNYWTLHLYYLVAILLTALLMPDSWGSVSNVYYAFLFFIFSLILGIFGGVFSNAEKQQQK